MHFLGSFGIDPALLIAQIINFGLLLWVLNKLVYKPIINRIEQDEQELEQVRTKEKALADAQQSFATEQELKRKTAETAATQMIAEAEIIAEHTKTEGRTRMEAETTDMIAQTKTALAAQKPMLEKQIHEQMAQTLQTQCADSFHSYLDTAHQKDLQSILFENLCQQIDEATIAHISETDRHALAEIKKHHARTYAHEFRQRVGLIGLEHALPITATQKKNLTQLIAKKVGMEIVLDTKPNPDLINGFRCEITGTVFESSISHLIHNITNAH